MFFSGLFTFQHVGLSGPAENVLKIVTGVGAGRALPSSLRNNTNKILKQFLFYT